MAQLYGRNGKTNDWKPLNCKQDADGNWQLCVDTELSVDHLSLTINNVKVGSTDQTEANARWLRTKADGTVYVEGTITVNKGNPVVYTGNAMLVAATVIFASAVKHIQLENMDGVKVIYISFDSGTKWRTMQPGYIIDIDCDSVATIDIKADADTAPYEMLVNE